MIQVLFEVVAKRTALSAKMRSKLPTIAILNGQAPSIDRGERENANKDRINGSQVGIVL